MKAMHWFSLVLLASISGSSFIFTRTLAPVLGPIGTADLRVLLAGVALLIYAAIIRFDVEWKQHWKLYAGIGLINSGLPFLLYSFAAVQLPASYLAIINASSPLFGALFSALWLGERLSSSKLGGLLLGMFGVGLVSYGGASGQNATLMVVASVGACVLAAMCYALSGVYIKLKAKSVKPLALAGCSQFAAGVLMAPLVAAQPVPGPVTSSVLLNLAALAIVCSAIAYLIYFRLIAEIGPTRTLTVTFLSPLFAMLAGHWILGEVVTAQMLIGVAVIIASTLMVNRVPAVAKLATSQ